MVSILTDHQLLDTSTWASSQLHSLAPRLPDLTEASILSLWQLTRSACEAPGLEGLSGAAPPPESSDDDSDTTSSSMSQSGSGSGSSVVPMVLGDGPAHERVRETTHLFAPVPL